jgi:hypothetical protein
MLLYAKHAKGHQWVRFRGRKIGSLLMGLMLSATTGHCFGEVYRCTDSSGRVLIGDQPCAVKNGGTSTSPKVKEPNALMTRQATQSDKEQVSMTRDSLEQKIESKHNLECRDMRGQLKKHGHFASNVLLLGATLTQDDRLIWERYQVACLAQAKDIVILDQAQRERADTDKVRKAACDIKTRDYEKRAQMLNNSSSDLERSALAVLQAEVSRGCR